MPKYNKIKIKGKGGYIFGFIFFVALPILLSYVFMAGVVVWIFVHTGIIFHSSIYKDGISVKRV